MQFLSLRAFTKLPKQRTKSDASTLKRVELVPSSWVRMALVLSFNASLHHHKQHLSCSINPTITKPANFCSNLNNQANHFIPANRRQLWWQLASTNLDSSEEEPIIQSSSEEDSDGEGYDLGVKAALRVLKFYKSEISPILPRSCRFVPTCSEYSMIAYKKYGFVKGTILTTWRICRCNPLGGSGFDPPRWFGEKTHTER